MEKIKYLWATCSCGSPSMKWTIFKWNFLCILFWWVFFWFYFLCDIASYPVPYPEKSMILLSWLQPSWFFRHRQDPFEESFLQAEQSKFSWSLLVWNVPIPVSSLWSFTALIPVCQNLSCVGEPRARPNAPGCVSSQLRKGEGSLSSCWPCSAWCSPGCCWSSQLQELSAGSQLTCVLWIQGPSMTIWFSAARLQACIELWDYCSPGTGLGNSPCGSSWGSCRSDHFSSLSRSPWVAAALLVIDHSSQFCVLLSRSLKKCCTDPSGAGCPKIFVLLIAALWVQQFTQLPTHLSIHI